MWKNDKVWLLYAHASILNSIVRKILKRVIFKQKMEEEKKQSMQIFEGNVVWAEVQ